jgi:peptidyl-prolyl cis-trans isomerase SurA
MKNAGLLVATLCLCSAAGVAQMATSHKPTLSKPSMSGAGDSVPLQAVGKAVVRVNGAVLSDRDLVREVYMIFPYAQQHNGLPKSMEADIKAGAMKMLVFEELVYQDAKRRHVTIAPEKLNAAVAHFRKQFAGRQYQEYLTLECGGDPAVLRSKVERSLLIEKILAQEVDAKSSVSLAEVKAYYMGHLDKFKVPESFEFQSISIIPPQNASPAQIAEAKKRAEKALQQARATKSYDEFGILAENLSDDDFHVMMGDHKTADRSKLPPTITSALDKMSVGTVSNLIEFDKNDFTILRLNAHVPAGQKQFTDVKTQLIPEMRKDKKERLRKQLDAGLRKSAKIEIL